MEELRGVLSGRYHTGWGDGPFEQRLDWASRGVSDIYIGNDCIGNDCRIMTTVDSDRSRQAPTEARPKE